jgi:ferredoxin
MPADDTCLTLAPRPESIGWCYVDPSANRGDPALVKKCPENEQQVKEAVRQCPRQAIFIRDE